jgi:hypothetical protein
MVDVGVERPDGEQDRVGVFAALPDPVLAVDDGLEAVLPSAGDLVGKAQ